jgi:hypothetical protein
MRHQIFISLALVMSACGGGTPDQDSGSGVEASSSYDEAYTAAVAAMEIAAHKGHAWTTSDQLIKDAAKAVEGGDEALAISLADEARKHAELAAIQAEDSAKSWRDSVVSE